MTTVLPSGLCTCLAGGVWPWRSWCSGLPYHGPWKDLLRPLGAQCPARPDIPSARTLSQECTQAQERCIPQLGIYGALPESILRSRPCPPSICTSDSRGSRGVCGAGERGRELGSSGCTSHPRTHVDLTKRACWTCTKCYGGGKGGGGREGCPTQTFCA
jgi:hypothetical protein